MAETGRCTDRGGEVTRDGEGSATKVGYEFITTEAGDRAEFPREVVDKLAAAMIDGELFLLLIDEAKVDADRLSRAAAKFLERVKGAQA